MILKCFCFLLSVVNINGYFSPVFRSSVMEGNKPILRMPVENSAEQIGSSPEEKIKSHPSWLEELRLNIKDLVEKLGHKKAKPQIQKLVEETENNNSVLLHVEVTRDGVSDIKYKYPMRAVMEPGFGMVPSYSHPTMTPEPEPSWLVDLKVFIKELIGRHGKRRLDEYITPVIRAIEKQHNIRIRDIDVDHYGEVYVNYEKTPPYRSGSNKRVKKTRKQHESSDESGDSSLDVSRHVTEIPMED